MNWTRGIPKKDGCYLLALRRTGEAINWKYILCDDPTRTPQTTQPSHLNYYNQYDLKTEVVAHVAQIVGSEVLLTGTELGVKEGEILGYVEIQLVIPEINDKIFPELLELTHFGIGK